MTDTHRNLSDTLSRPVRLFPPGLSTQPEALVHAANLPAPLAHLASSVIKRTRLWHSERLDVARELVAHFRDGLESGAPAEDLARSFGDPVHAARLIRRAKKRSRPLAWRAAAASLKSLALLFLACLAVYLFSAARAFLSHPTISHNYTAEINAPIAAIPESDRAWPIYRQAYLAEPRVPAELAKDFPAFYPGDEHWPAAMAYLKDCSECLSLIRQAAARPVLGRPVSDTTDPELDAHAGYLAGKDRETARTEAFASPSAHSDEPNPNLISVLLPHLGQGRQFARILSLDARAAVEDGDGARATSDIDAMYRLAGHMRDNGFLIGDLVGIAIQALASETLGTILAEKPAVLSQDQLATLAHAAARAPLTLVLDGERLFMADTLQRVYTDDGSGDGHLTAQGIRTLFSYAGTPGKNTPDAIREAIEIPAIALVSASRRDMEDQYTRMLAESLSYASISPWLRPDRSPDEDVEHLTGSFQGKRYMLISLLMPALTRAVWAHDAAALRRDGLLVAVALELHKRRSGSYPASLDDIPAALLPSVPRDMFDGKSIRYVMNDHKPVIYSIGTDRKDDGGRPIKSDSAYGGRWMSRAAVASTLASRQANTIDGDWILWPPAPRSPAPPASHDAR